MEERPRKAFVVGCEGYTHWPAIKHGIEDAKAFGEVLERLCLFSVFVSYDATRNDFLSLEKTMTQNLKEGGDFLFFFSGHGVYNNGYQYLVPVDGDMENKQTWIKLDKLMQPAKEVSGGTPLVQRQVGKLMAADPAPGARLFIILDCCRAEGDGSNETSPELIGLQQPTTPYFIVHACLKASKAKWGEHHGYLTESFLEVIEDPKSVGKDITTIAKKVADKCINKTQFQLPEVHTTITGEFYFRRGNAGASSSADEGNAGASSSAGEGDAGASSSADEGNAGASSSAGEGNAGASSSAGEGGEPAVAAIPVPHGNFLLCWLARRLCRAELLGIGRVQRGRPGAAPCAPHQARVQRGQAGLLRVRQQLPQVSGRGLPGAASTATGGGHAGGSDTSLLAAPCTREEGNHLGHRRERADRLMRELMEIVVAASSPSPAGAAGNGSIPAATEVRSCEGTSMAAAPSVSVPAVGGARGLHTSHCTMPGTQRQRKAFLVGCQSYTQWPALLHGNADAKAFGEVLKQLCDFQVVHRFDATHNALIEFKNLMAQNLSTNDDFLFYFSGHGVYNQGSQYLVPIDGDKVNKKTWVNFDELVQPATVAIDSTPLARREVGADPAPGARLFMILDCCRSEGDGSPEESLATIGHQRPIVQYFIMHACQKASDAKEGTKYGYLTESFLEELRDPKSIGMDIKAIAANVTRLCTEKNPAQLPKSSYSLFGEFVFRRGT